MCIGDADKKKGRAPCSASDCAPSKVLMGLCRPCPDGMFQTDEGHRCVAPSPSAARAHTRVQAQANTHASHRSTQPPQPTHSPRSPQALFPGAAPAPARKVSWLRAFMAATRTRTVLILFMCPLLLRAAAPLCATHTQESGLHRSVDLSRGARWRFRRQGVHHGRGERHGRYCVQTAAAVPGRALPRQRIEPYLWQLQAVPRRGVLGRYERPQAHQVQQAGHVRPGPVPRSGGRLPLSRRAVGNGPRKL